MKDADRFQLIGTYATPRVKIGTVLSCEACDCNLIVTGYTDARVPWPVGRRKGTAGYSPVVYGALVEAIRRESNQAVCHHFGVTAQTVSKWRKAPGVGIATPGTSRLHSDYTREPWAAKARKKGQQKNSDPERRAKIAEARRGKARPRHVIEAMRRGRKGKPHSPETRAKMRASRQRYLAERQTNGDT